MKVSTAGTASDGTMNPEEKIQNTPSSASLRTDNGQRKTTKNQDKRITGSVNRGQPRIGHPENVALTTLRTRYFRCAETRENLPEKGRQDVCYDKRLS